MSRIGNFFKDEGGGVLAAEYVIFVAAIGIILVVGVVALMRGFGSLFNAWSFFFRDWSTP